MDQSNLFNTARVRINGKCAIVDMREPQLACSYHLGKIGDACKRCSQPYQRHYPELSRSRQAKRIVTMCDVCSYPVDSDQHINHCRG